MNEVQNRNIFNGLMFKKKRSKKEEKTWAKNYY